MTLHRRGELPPHCELPLNLDAPRHLLSHIRLALRGQCALLCAEEVQDARRVARRRREVGQIERHQVKRYDARSRAACISPTDSARDSAGRMSRNSDAARRRRRRRRRRRLGRRRGRQRSSAIASCGRVRAPW